MIVLTLGRISHLTVSCSVLLSPVSSEENMHPVCEICWESGVKKVKKRAGETVTKLILANDGPGGGGQEAFIIAPYDIDALGS